MDDPTVRREMVEQVKRGMSELDERVKGFRRQQTDFWKEAVGDALDEMLTSREAAIRLLDHNNGKIRSTALQILTQIWRLQGKREFRGKLQEMALSDPEYDVRTSAIIALGDCCCNSNDAEIARLFGRIVMDDSAPIPLREAAYQALFSVRGLLPNWVERYLTGFDFPSDVDWPFVSQCINDNP